MGEPDFICAICQHNVSMRWSVRNRARETIPPLCRSCEIVYSHGSGKAAGGTYRDRRMVDQGFALAEALRGEAAHRSWQDAWRIIREA